MNLQEISMFSLKKIDSAASSSVRASWPRHLAAGVALVSAVTTTAFAAEPYQSPMIKVVGSMPPPNVMLTLDTSWSMNFPYVPEGTFQVNGFPMTFPSFRALVVHPDDPRVEPNSVRAAAGNQGVMMSQTSAAAANYYEKALRSPDVNSIYYNPEVLYLPWLKFDATKTDGLGRYDPAKFTAAVLDPNNSIKAKDETDGSTTNLKVVDLSATGSRTEKWCTSVASCTPASSKNFNPGIYYRLSAGSDPTDANKYVQYNLNTGTDASTDSGSTASTYKKYAARTDCTADGGTKCSRLQERQNFANWFVYYRNRLLLSQASIPEALIPKRKDFRLGYGTIHKGETTVDGLTKIKNVEVGIRDIIGTDGKTPSDAKATAQMNSMVVWLRNIRNGNSGAATSPALTGSTPLRSALNGVGDYFSRADAVGSPWRNTPGETTSSSSLSCRRSYHILVTDGYYSDSEGGTGVDTDSKDGTEVTGGGVKGTDKYTYKPTKPYLDNTASNAGGPTMADLAMKYWMTDLSTTMANQVTASKDNPAFWQHLVQYPVGLGVSGTIRSLPSGKVHPDDLAALSDPNGTLTWWGGSTDQQKVNDMTHAALNSRGRYFSAKSSSELASALTTALGDAGKDGGVKEGGVATLSVLLSAGNRKYVPEYTTVSWTGELKAYELNAQGVAGAKLWDATVPATNRTVITWTGTAADTFELSKMASTKNLIVGANDTEKTSLVKYVAGDDTLEKSGLYRARDSKLGDFINSTPTLIKGNVDLAYENLDVSHVGETVSSVKSNRYRTFYTDKAARDGVLFIGGNDGMLHAFNDTNGVEKFAYVPKAVLPNIHKLAAMDYGSSTGPNYHQFFVDGPLVESDAFFGGGWKNVLVGTTGAGARAIFAMNVTDNTTMGTSTVMWERSSLDGTVDGVDRDEAFGYMMGDPQVGILKDGEWWAFVGNGPYSGGKKAKLIGIRLRDGLVNVLATNATTDNGLGGVRLVRDARGYVEAAYAGDLKGNLWRFEFGTGGTSAWKLGFGDDPLAVAKDAAGNTQPITAMPAIVPHPSGGFVVIFGTGKLFDKADQATITDQTFYGLWDPTKLATNSTTSPFAGQTTLRNLLLAQTTSASTTTGYYNVTTTAITDWNTKKGWYLDIKLENGQRSIYPPTIIRDFVLLSSIVPAQSAAFCETSGGSGYNFLLTALSGSQSTEKVLDTDGDGDIDGSDIGAAGYKTNADGRDAIVRSGGCASGGSCEGSIQNTTGKQNFKLPDPPVPLPPKLGDRVWRQILNPPTPAPAP
jgi:type IV pilus assembly protein PilY1